MNILSGSIITKQGLPRHKYSLRNSLGLNRFKPLKPKTILNEVNNLLVSAVQDNENTIKNKQLSKMIQPLKIKGPVHPKATLEIRNRARIKCPPGSRLNRLQQCIRIR